MARAIEVQRGRTSIFAIHLTDADGYDYNLKNGETLVFGVKKRATHEELLLKKTVTEGIGGCHIIKLLPSETIDLAFGKYFYDVGLKSGDDYFPIIKASPFVISENITKSGDA